MIRTGRATVGATGDLDALQSNYIDLFVATVDDATQATAESWARAAMQGASAAGRFLAWRALCNLRLGPQSSPNYIAGWRIVERDDRWIRVQADSWFMTVNIVFLAEGRQVFFATLIRYDNPMGRLIWGTVSVVHRRIAPDFLRAGVMRILRKRPVKTLPLSVSNSSGIPAVRSD